MNNQTLIENLSSVLDKVFRSNDDISSTNIKEIYSDDTGLEAILNTPGRLVFFHFEFINFQGKRRDLCFIDLNIFIFGDLV